MRKFHYGWFICAICTGLLCCTVGVNAGSFAVYVPHIIEAGNLTQAQGSLVLTVRNLTSLIGTLAVSLYLKKLGLRMGMVIAAFLGAIAFFLYSTSDNFFSFCCAAALSGFSCGFGGLVPVSFLINNWFEDHRALALSVCSAGSGFAAVIFPPIVTLIVENISLRAAFLFDAILFSILAIMGMFILRDQPQEKGLEPLIDHQRSSVNLSHISDEKPHIETASKSTIILLQICAIAIGISSYGAIPNLSVHYITEGFDPLHISLFISFYGIMLTIGKCVFGEITDLFSARCSYLIFFPLYCLGVFLCCFAGTQSYVICFFAMLCCGLGNALSTVGLSVFAREMSSPESYKKIVHQTQTIFLVGATIVGPFPGIIADLTGSYTLSYLFCAVMLVFGFFILHISFNKRRREKSKPQSSTNN